MVLPEREETAIREASVAQSAVGFGAGNGPLDCRSDRLDNKLVSWQSDMNENFKQKNRSAGAAEGPTDTT